MNIKELQNEVHENAKAHGWWDEDRTFGELIALCHSELSEALEEYRNCKPTSYHYCKCDGGICSPKDFGNECCMAGMETECTEYDPKPEGIAMELADAVIRILDLSAGFGIDLESAILVKHEYNKTRTYRHGGKAL